MSWRSNHEAWAPILFALAAALVFTLIVSYGVLGHDYARTFEDKHTSPTFFEEKVKTVEMYTLLIFVNIALGFFITLYQCLIGPHRFNVLDSSNNPAQKTEIMKRFYGGSKSVMVVTTLAGEVWTRISQALVLYLSFTDLYVLLGGLAGSMLASVIVIMHQYGDKKTDISATTMAKVAGRLSF